MIKFNHDYHGVELDLEGAIPTDLFEWLQSQFGPGDGDRWFYKHPTVYFVNQRDHMMFLLRWA